MDDGADQPPEDNLARMVAASLAGALDGMVKRSEEGDRLSLIRTLRSQMGQVLAEAPVKGDLVKAITLRTRMAALLDAEFTRMEAAEEKRQQP